MFNRWRQDWLSCEYFIPPVFISNSSNLQITAEASFISSISVIVIFIWIGVRSISFHVSLLFDEMLHRGTYDGTGRLSKGGLEVVPGACRRLHGCHSIGSLNKFA